MLRVTVDTGGLILRYRAERDLAHQYQRRIERSTGFRVSLTDGRVDGLPAIPCEQLFQLA